MSNANKIELTRPGEHLAEIIESLDITKYALAKAMGVPPITISRIVNGSLTITIATAIKLGQALDMTPDFWVNLQSNYDLAMAKRQRRPGKVIRLVEDGRRVANG
jgi:addiction module HigA family antidote